MLRRNKTELSRSTVDSKCDSDFRKKDMIDECDVSQINAALLRKSISKQ